MNEPKLDYAEVGLIAGLEVHQQLLTEKKMFCHCPAGKYTRTHDGVMLRHMRPTLSELGEYDGTALMEFKTRKNIIYLLHKDNVCTYEMDDTPPFLVNQQALDVAIEQCLMLGCDIVDEVHIARKQYLDGSIPTGFQRTAIVGVNGKLPFRDRMLSITQVSVEEDSCREVQDRGHLIVWRTDRLGMPLIETVTGADLRTPDEVEEAILLIGRVCRSTGHVRTGSGASRQDVNVSVRGGRRVEIKGVPQADWAPGLVHGEAVRQVNLLRLRDDLHRRGFRRPDDVVIQQHDVTSVMSECGLPFLRQDHWDRFVNEENRRPGFELGEGPFCVRAIRLKGLGGTLGWPTQPEHIFAHELAGRVRVIAGLDQQPILLHNEKWPDYVGSQRELRRVKQATGCDAADALVLVWGAAQDTRTAAEEIRLRYVDALHGIPNETRQPFADGSTDFERILPGPDRMYPDTDSPPTRVDPERIKGLGAVLPDPPWIREQRYASVSVPVDTIRYLIRRNGAAQVDRAAKRHEADLRRTCFLFGEKLKGLRRSGLDVDLIPQESWDGLLDRMSQVPVLWEVWRLLVTSLATHPGVSLETIVQREGLTGEPPDWPGLVRSLHADHRPDHRPSQEGLARFYMGRAMQTLRGRVAGARVAQELRAILADHNDIATQAQRGQA